MTAKVVYEGDLRCSMTHLYSGSQIESDAPLDNQGLAQRFSPTDLTATSLGSCMMTVMGIKARDMGLNLKGTQIEVTKVMAANPRRIAEIHCTLNFPPNNFTDKDKTILENTARTCPVSYSLHPDIKQLLTFNW
ncbi:MAG: OsmC family protein [Chitinophagales bacterium]